MAAEPGWAARWDEAYAQGGTRCSWFQDAPEMSLRMLDAAGVTASASVIDVGGGTSPLAGALLERGFRDVTVLDISAAAMEQARHRLGPRAGEVHWLTADIRAWRPPRRYAAWHDRAVFHFLTAEPDRRDYRRALAEATTLGAVAVVGCFAPDGPQRCSGLPVTDTFDELGKAARDGAGWHECPDRLVAELDGTPQRPMGELWVEVHPRYVTHLGPGAATIGPPPGHDPRRADSQVPGKRGR
jgi:SAM-dependent methyltransferase